MAQTFEDYDPRLYGFDAAAGFPPHNCGFSARPIQDTLEYLDPDFQGTVVKYTDMIAAALANRPTEYRLFPGVCPSWDSEPRKPGRGFSLLGSTPEAYRDWLTKACENTLATPNRDERIVFINAWNEWGEGAHLERDRHLGYAYLNGTARVVQRLSGADDCVLDHVVRPTPAPSARRELGTLPALFVKSAACYCANSVARVVRLLRRLAAI